MARESIGDLVRVIITFAVGKYFTFGVAEYFTLDGIAVQYFIEAMEQMFHGFI